MKQIYEDIISNGATGLVDEYIDETPNPALVAEDEIYSIIRRFPVLVEMLKVCIPQLPDETAQVISELIDIDPYCMESEWEMLKLLNEVRE